MVLLLLLPLMPKPATCFRKVRLRNKNRTESQKICSFGGTPCIQGLLEILTEDGQGTEPSHIASD